jgi:peptidoglycan/xylan/chitin deacetylase (PgdA/CDA1 family)
VSAVVNKAISFCFDDGFRASADKIQRLFAQRGRSACFCALAAPELADDPFIRAAPIADWAYWREAVAAGHEVAPHGYSHEYLGKLSFAAACDSVQRTLDVFQQELPGFDANHSLFHLAYLSAPAEVVQWIGARTLGARMALGAAGRNDLTAWKPGKPIDCTTFAPPDADAVALQRIERFIQDEGGWLVLVFHGLDGEGWGTVSSDALTRMLDHVERAGIDIAPPNRVLQQFTGASTLPRDGISTISTISM